MKHLNRSVAFLSLVTAANLAGSVVLYVNDKLSAAVGLFGLGLLGIVSLRREWSKARSSS